MFYLMMKSTHFIYGCIRKEGNVLFNDTLNTFYLWLYGYSGSKIENTQSPYGLLFPISIKGSFICIIPQTHTTAFVTPVVEHWLEQEMAPPWRIDPMTHRAMSKRSYHGATSHSSHTHTHIHTNTHTHTHTHTHTNTQTHTHTYTYT